MSIQKILQTKPWVISCVAIQICFLSAGLLVNKPILCFLTLAVLVAALIWIDDSFGVYLILVKNLFFGFLISMFSVPNQLNYIEDLAILILLVKWVMNKKRIDLPLAFRRFFLFFSVLFFGFTIAVAFINHLDIMGLMTHERLFLRFILLIIIFSDLRFDYLWKILKICYFTLVFQIPLVLYQYVFIVVRKKIAVPQLWVGNAYMDRTLNDYVGGIFGYDASDVLGISAVICFLGTIIYLSLNSKQIGLAKKVFFFLSCLIFLFMPFLSDAKIALLFIPLGVLTDVFFSKEKASQKSFMVLYLALIVVIGMSISGIMNISFEDTFNNFILSAEAQFKPNEMIQRGESLVYCFDYLSKRGLLLWGQGMGSHFNPQIKFTDYRIGIYNYQASYLLLEIGLSGVMMVLVLLLWIPYWINRRVKIPENNEQVLIHRMFSMVSLFSIIMFFYTNFFYNPALTFLYGLLTAMAIRSKWPARINWRGCGYGNIGRYPLI